MRARWLKEGTIYGLALTVSRFTGALLAPIYTRFMSRSEYGLLDLATTFAAVLFIVTEMQMVAGFQRSYYGVRERGERHLLTGSILAFYGLSAALCLSVVWLARGWLLAHMPGLPATFLIPVLIGILPAEVVLLGLEVLRLEHRAQAFLMLSVAKIILSAGIGITAVVVLETGALGVLWGLVLSDLILTPVCLIVLARITGFGLSRRYLREMFHYGAPVMPAVLGRWVLPNASRFFIAGTLTLSLLGTYSLASKVAAVVLLAAMSFRRAWEPYAYKQYEVPGSERFFARSLNLYLVGMVAVLVMLGAAAPVLVRLIAAPDYWDATPFVVVIAAGLIWNVASVIVSSGNNWERKTYFNTFGSVVSALATIALLWFGTERYGLPFVAGVFLATAALKSSLTLGTAQRNHPIPYSYWAMALAFMATVALSVLCYHTTTSGWTLPVVVAVNLAVGLALLALLWFAGMPAADRAWMLNRRHGDPDHRTRVDDETH